MGSAMEKLGWVSCGVLAILCIVTAESQQQGNDAQEYCTGMDDEPTVSWVHRADGFIGKLTCVHVQGSWMKTNANTTFASFQGIPYASPPVHQNRFLRPKQIEYNTDPTTVNAQDTFKTVCPQPGQVNNTFMSEDCLYLNVYTFQKEEALRPVMIFIHGGAFHSGDGTWDSFGPQHFLDKDVIVVTLNYRLGALGFLSLGSSIMPGNMGLWDQRAALQWVQEHITYFGGDPEQVTVFGESAGSWSVMYQLLSSQSQGLFQKMIGESGSPLSTEWGFITPEEAVKNGELFAATVGCDVADLICFQNLPLNLLLSLNSYLDDQTDHPAFTTGNPWNGVVDQEFTNDPFFHDSPLNILKNGDFDKNIQIILGANQDEGLLDTVVLFFYPDLYDEMSSNWDHYGPLSVLGKTGLGDITDEDKEISRNILEFYTGSVENITLDNFQALTDMKTDATFWYGIEKTISLLAGHGVQVYQYIFSYRGQHSFLDSYGVPPGLFGVCHADELFYLFDPFGHLDLEDVPNSDENIRELLVTSWTNFAKFGDPTPPGSGISWTPITTDSNLYLNISGTDSILERSINYEDRMQFWSAVVNK